MTEGMTTKRLKDIIRPCEIVYVPQHLFMLYNFKKEEATHQDNIF